MLGFILCSHEEEMLAREYEKTSAKAVENYKEVVSSLLASRSPFRLHNVMLLRPTHDI
jgi:hypothetical protein